MEVEVHNFGSILEACVKTNNDYHAHKLIKYVRTYLNENVGSSTLNFMISLIFDESYNLNKFLVHISDSDKGWKNVLSDGLDLLHHVLKNFYDNLQPYTVEITKSCRHIATSKATAFEKTKALDILCLILNEGSSIPHDIVEDMYNKFYNFCTVHQTTTSAKVQKHIFVLLGIITKKYPFLISNSTKLIDTYINQLRRQSEATEKNRDKNVVSGCIDGLSDILDTFPIENIELRCKIYNIINKLIIAGSKTSSFDLRDVIIFLSKHCSMLAENMYKDSPELWHTTIRKWVLLSGENRKAGYMALEVFYSEIATVLKTRTEERDKNIFQYFYDYFLRTMKDETADVIEVRLAIRGFGVFSAPCEVHMTNQKLSQMFIIIINRMEQDYFVKESPTVEQLEYLPDYIHCFSTILHQIGEYTYDQIDSLQQISVLMIKTFPSLSSLYHYSVFDSLILSMCYLYQFNPRSLENYLQRVVYQGVLWTCSHRTTFDIDLQNADNDKTVTYKDYLPLWRSLLSFINSSNSKYNSIPISVRKSVVQTVYDELIKTLLLLINKLNLNTKYLDDVPVIDPTISCEAEKIDDYIIFINVVDFYLDLLTVISHKCFKKWIKMCTNQVLLKSVKYPFVSGFYKLLKMALQISDHINYFDESKMLEKEDIQMCYKMICAFLENVLLKVQEFKDDLQVSCLELLLTVPISFVKPLIQSMTPVFHMAFTVGRGYLKLAEIAVDSLERWYKVLPEDDMKPLLINILPNLDAFLRSKGFSGDPDIKLSLLQGKKSKQSKIKRKILIESDGQLANLQHKILMFIGQLSSEMCVHMVESNIQVEEVTWEKEPHLKFTIPYSEVKPIIYLDKLVPRVLELALTSGDQKTRITACEFLHSIVIFMIGTSREMSVTKSKELRKLFEKVMLPIIQLGCDSNSVVSQLFNPLVFQIVHWYSSPIQRMSSETTILTDILMEGISHPTDTAVRDLSGKCIKEFVIWTIKQCQKEDLKIYSQNIQLIVNKICSYSSHPNSFKRLGAALAFNNIYVVLREEESMVEKYWIELFYSLMISMSLEDARHSQCKVQLDAALDHIERVLIGKKVSFNRYNSERRVPLVIEEPILKNVVSWILQQTESNNTVYRRKSIKLFCNLAAHVDECSTAKDFIVKFVECENATWFLDRYESKGIDKMPTLSSYQGQGSSEILLKWLQYVLRCLDGYKFLLDYNIINYDDLTNDSKILEAIGYFIDFVSRSKLAEAVKLFSHFDKDYIYMPEENEEFFEQKYSLTIRIFDYLLSAINKNTSWCDKLCTNNFWNYLCLCVYQPNTLEYDSISKDFPNKLIELFNKFSDKLPEVHLNNLILSLHKYFNSNYKSIPQYSSHNISLTQRNLLKGWLLIQKCNFKTKNTNQFSNSIEVIFSALVRDKDDIKTGVVLQSTLQEYAELQLTVALQCGDRINILCNCISNNEEIKNPETNSLVTYGEYFFNTFKDVIMDYILNHSTEVIKNLTSKWKDFNDNNSLLMLINILKYLADNSHLRKKFNYMEITDTILLCCHRVFDSSPDVSLKNRNFQIEFMSHIDQIDYNKSYIIGNRYKYFTLWFISQLNYEKVDETPKNILQFKSNILSFLHCVTGPDDDEDAKLESALKSFQNKIFHTSTNQIENSDRLVLFKKLLDYLVISKSRIVLRSVLDVFTTIKYDETNVNIHKALHLYLTTITPKQQFSSLSIVYLKCFDAKYSPENKHKFAKIFLLSMLRICSYDAFEQFYIQNMKTIINELNSKLSNESDANMIVNKSVNLILVDVLFSRIKITGFLDKTCKITKAVYGEKLASGKEMLVELTGILKSNRKEKLHFDDIHIKEQNRLYQCDAYNALVSIISNSKKSPDDVDIYSYLFYENKKSGEHIWENIIDCNKIISFPQDFDTLPARKKNFINIRNENIINQNKAIRYIESQSLFNSTLSEDVCKFDFTNTLIRNVDLEKTDNITDNSIQTIDMESVDINNHECIATVCGVINHLIDNKISPLPSDNINDLLPKWLILIKKIFLDDNTQVNVKIFFARVIHNMKFIFKYYAKYFFQPIVKFISDGCTGNNINYFDADLVEMLIEWSDKYDLFDEKESASQLISFLMNHAHNDRQDIMKYNLEIIKTCVEKWKSFIDVPYDILYCKLSSNSTKLVAVHLAAILLVNELIPWSDSNVDNFTKNLVVLLQKEDKKVIYKPAAELIGMILKYMSSNDVMKSNLSNQLYPVLDKFKTDKLFHSLEQIQRNYPEIIDKYIRKINMMIYSQSDPALKSICLKNILRRFDSLEVSPLSSKDLIEFMNINDSDVRLLTLQIINKCVEIFKKQHLTTVLTVVCEHKMDPNAIIRCAVYDILITVYKKYMNADDTESKDMVKLCKSVLLSAVIDPDLELQTKILKFWCKEQYKSLKLSEKFERSLTDLYSPETELHYLGCVNFFLLDSCEETPEYGKLMFDHPLSECKFDEYQLLINWRAQHASMAPMFSSSMAHTRLDAAVPELVGVRASNSLKMFTPTASSLDLSSSLNTASSFLFTPSQSSISTTQLNQSVVNVDDDKKYKQHGRRFLSSRSKISLGFAKYETEKKRKTEQQRKERVKRNEANVVMYREYRKGELPDVQIPNSAIIKPLQILARRDVVLARQLYSMLFNGLINEMQNSDEFIQNYNLGVLSVFNQTYMYVPNVIGALLDVSYENNKKKNIKKIIINADTLSTVCKNSGLYPIGCLMLEEYINLNDDDDSPSTSKKGCGSISDNVNYWLKLADMYKELNEWDTVIGIFSSRHMNCSLEISKAVQAEASGSWRVASNLYLDLLKSDTNSNRQDFYYESYFKCFANLSEWENISKKVLDVSEESLWDGDFNQDKLLPWYMLAEMCAILEGSTHNTVLNNLNDWMKDKEKSEYLKDKFSEELAMLALQQNDSNSSKHYAKNCLSKFLEDWSHQNPLFTKIRSNKLLNFQKVIDLNKYLSCNDKHVVDLVDYYRRNVDFSSYSVSTTEIRTLYRQQLLKSLDQRLISQDIEEYTPILKDLTLTANLNLISNSLDKHNYFLARKYCIKNSQTINSEDEVSNFKLALALTKVGTLIADKAEGKNKLKKLVKSLENIDTESKKYPNMLVDLKIESDHQIHNITQKIFNSLQTNIELLPLFSSDLRTIISSKTDLIIDLQNYSVNKLRSAIDLGEHRLVSENNLKIQNNLIDTYLKLIEFAQNQDDSEMYHPDIVKYVLRAMELGSRDARQLFPCLLDLPDLEGSLLELFKSESLKVPTWMFIIWIPQLLIALNTAKLKAVDDIVINLATTYPQALIYAYRIARENFDFSTGTDTFKNIIYKLDNLLLQSDLVNTFLSELSCICLPELYFSYHLKKLLLLIDDCSRFKEALSGLNSDITRKCNSSNHFKSIGHALKKIENKVNEKYDKQDISKFIIGIISDNSTLAKSTKFNKYVNLKQCSQWLAKFKSSDWNTELEIPGQYTGERKPLVKYHAKIASFNSKITMLSSMRKPFKIVMHGNDSKEYPFLVKFAEDLRQDQRIQQLFSLANNILQSDEQCQQRNLHLEQYQIIPLSTSLGLIQMVEVTASLNKFLYDSVSDEDTKAYKKLQMKYMKWISANNTGNIPECYYKACLKYSKNDTNIMFTQLVNDIPADILSKSFWNISMDTESYTYLRQQFITSYATMCIVNWIIGIGDRNLENCLIQQNTGRALGIDFGCAFGAATQHCPVPELIPFRLTPHILHLMEPLKEIGFIGHTMIHCLKALRKQKHILLSTMNIFIKDPTVDWLEHANNQDNNSSSSDWYPNQKIALASRKLEGSNPVAITVEELKNGAIRDSKVLDAYIKVAKGDCTNIRYKLPSDGLTEEEQVQCLLDQATDYNILGRMYCGLELWM